MSSSITAFFGNGCFFHTQHLFIIKFEEKTLKRSSEDITSVSAYGGGKLTDSSIDSLCYHNENDYNDYGSSGFAEVVSLSFPPTNLIDAADTFFSDFTEIDTNIYSRKDFFDVGAEYRAVIGIPGGITGDYFGQIEKANINNHNLTLAEGFGDEKDTLTTNTVYIYDTTTSPSFQAEVCLQFNDDNPVYSPPYSERYHKLSDEVTSLHDTSCPKNYIC